MPDITPDEMHRFAVDPKKVITPSAEYESGVCNRAAQSGARDEDVRQLLTCLNGAADGASREIRRNLRYGADPSDRDAYVWETAGTVCTSVPEVDRFKGLPPAYWATAARNGVRGEYRRRRGEETPETFDSTVELTAPLTSPDAVLFGWEMERALYALGATEAQREEVAELLDGDAVYPIGLPPIDDPVRALAAAATVILEPDLTGELLGKTADTQRKQLERRPAFRAMKTLIRRRLELLEGHQNEQGRDVARRRDIKGT